MNKNTSCEWVELSNLVLKYLAAFAFALSLTFAIIQYIILCFLKKNATICKVYFFLFI